MATWIEQRTTDARFPVRIAIEQDGRVLFAFRAKAAWPGPGAQVFCLREREFDPTEALETVDRVPVRHLARLGAKLSVTLDRAQRKRCEFLVLHKPLRDGSGTYEQVFFRTEAAVRAHKTAKRAELSLAREAVLDVAIDSAERYPWAFPGAQVVRRRLPVGDYALLHEDRVVAIAERKTLDNLLRDLSQWKGLQQHLAELAGWPHAAVVIEAQYGDLGDPAKIGDWPAAHLLRIVAEAAALFPNLPLVFAGNRKLANVWTQRWFAAVAAKVAQPLPDAVREPLARFAPATGLAGLDERVRLAALRELPARFEAAALRRRFPEATAERIRRVLDALRGEGRLATEGRGRGTVWVRTVDP